MFDKHCNFVPTKAFKHHWTQSTFSYMKKPRPDYGIMLVLNGRIDFVSLQTEILCAKAGDIIFLPKNAYYEARFLLELGTIDNYLINFESDMEIKHIKPMLICENASFEYVDRFQQFVDEMYNIEIAEFRRKGLFYLLFDAILNTNKSTESAHDSVVEKAKSILEKTEDIPISQIAKECSVSESGLRKIFTEKLGLSPTQFRLKEKFNKAKYLLESTDMSVGEIADNLNFYDAAYFCKMFQRKTGLSPIQYRQNKKL